MGYLAMLASQLGSDLAVRSPAPRLGSVEPRLERPPAA
jgi:hypothetical protein